MGKYNEAVVKRADFYHVDPEKIAIMEGWNPRQEIFDPETDAQDKELFESIKANGVIQPITVRNIGGVFTLIDGYRRYCAVMMINKNGGEIQSLPAMMARKGISDIEAMVAALNSNTGKRLKPSEEAEAFNRLIGWGMSAGDIGKRVGKSYMHVKRRLELVDASPEVKVAVDNKEVNIQDAITVVKESEGSIEKQAEGLEKAKKEKAEKKAARKEKKPAHLSEQETNPQKPAEKSTPGEFKMLTRKQIETLLAERKGILAHSTDRLKYVNEGVIIALSMVLYGQTQFTGELSKE